MTLKNDNGIRTEKQIPKVKIFEYWERNTTNDAGIPYSNYYQKDKTPSYGIVHSLWNDSKLLYATSLWRTKLIINGNYPSFYDNTNWNKYNVNSIA